MGKCVGSALETEVEQSAGAVAEGGVLGVVVDLRSWEKGCVDGEGRCDKG